MNGVGIDGAAPRSLRRLWSWPQLRPVSTLLEPDPFEEEERDKILATRHSSISIALTKGANLKWLATYCGTSIEMIERHYSKWLGNDDDQLALLVRRGAERARRGPQGGPL